MRQTILLGRIFFSLIFITAGFGHFTRATIDYAASQGVPFPELLVPFSGLLAIFGGLSVLLGYKAKIGAWALVLFLVPVTLKMHAFWMIADPEMAQLQRIMFFKNLSMLGGALTFAYFGAGALSLDSRSRGGMRTLGGDILPSSLKRRETKATEEGIRKTY